jgi:hypothetical protein
VGALGASAAYASATDLYFVKTENTGSGRIEVHTATAASGYARGIDTATRFSATDAGAGLFGLLPNNDLYFMKTVNTGSGKIEIHTATAASGYATGISTATLSPAADAGDGSWGLLPNNDLYHVKTVYPSSGTIEAHTATAASGYATGIHSATRFSPADAGDGSWGLLPNNDLYFVKRENTGSGTIEVHTATAASGYARGISWATRFSASDGGDGSFGLLG